MFLGYVCVASVTVGKKKNASQCFLPACAQSRWAPALWGRNGADLT